MDELKFRPFTLSLSKIGSFKRREGNIYWLGVNDNETLYSIHKKVHQCLTDKGFELEDREYKPHITLGRRVILKDDFIADELKDLVGKIKIHIDKVDLMKSEFTNGKLKYNVLYSKGLA